VADMLVSLLVRRNNLDVSMLENCSHCRCGSTGRLCQIIGNCCLKGPSYLTSGEMDGDGGCSTNRPIGSLDRMQAILVELSG
jgi:hypothetical protein